MNLSRDVDIERALTRFSVFQRFVIQAILREILIQVAWRVTINIINLHWLWLGLLLIHSSTCFNHWLFGGSLLVLLTDERLVNRWPFWLDSLLRLDSSLFLPVLNYGLLQEFWLLLDVHVLEPMICSWLVAVRNSKRHHFLSSTVTIEFRVLDVLVAALIV
jgi:hypothetical protein